MRFGVTQSALFTILKRLRVISCTHTHTHKQARTRVRIVLIGLRLSSGFSRDTSLHRPPLAGS